MLDRIEVFNFKSYKGQQTIGPFHAFTCVIGPNGSGKSNLMDAISFVLGVRSAQLRSSQLKDLIYRSGADDDDNEQEEQARTASVTAVYTEGEEEWQFQRNITSSGTSEYKINGKTMTYAKYNAVLEQHNILVKAKNFLVFQGDVEAVASQQPKDLSKLIDQISGSSELKDEYEKAKVAQDKAVETSTSAFNKRRGINTEIKQFKEQKAEAIKYDKLREERDAAVIHHLVWKLYHIQQGIETKTASIDKKNESVKSLRAEQTEHENKAKAARKEQAKAQKDVLKQEKLVSTREKELDEKRPTLLSVETKIAHASKKSKNAETLIKTVQKDREARADVLAKYEKDLKEVRKLVAKHQEERRKASQEKGLVLNEDDLKEYRRLKGQASAKAVPERQSFESQSRDARAKKDTLASLTDKLEQAKHRSGKLEAEQSTLDARQAETSGKSKSLTEDLNRVRRDLNDAVAERTRNNQTQTELNEKLQECYTKLFQAGADQRESERETKLKETLSNLQRSMPGKVLGRVVDLCKPTQRKYDAAVSVILGRHIDSIVVDSEDTAIACIQDMRNARTGTATFLPLDTIQAKPINDKYRALSRGARLAVDVIQFDPSVERAMHHVCSNALVCDTVEVAKYICYEKSTEVKAVTLDGTVFHKAGLITGGTTNAGTGRKWEEAQVQGLKRLEESLRQQLAELAKSRPRGNQDDRLTAEISRLETELTVSKDDLSAARNRLNGIRTELAVVQKQVKDLSAQVDQATSEMSDLQSSLDDLRSVIAKEEKSIFADFCDRVGIADIQEYEDKQLRQAQEEGETDLKYKTQISRLEHQTAFEKEQLQGIDDRLTALQATLDKHTAAMTTLQGEKTAAEQDLVAVEEEIEAMRDELKTLEDEAASKVTVTEQLKKTSSKSNSAFQKAMKEISGWNDDIERFASERFSIFRRCKLEEIDLPITAGSLEDVPIEENLRDAMPMDIHQNDDTQQAVTVNDYGIELDFAELEDEETEDDTAEMDEKLQAEVTRLIDEIQKMSPNMKAIDKLDDVEAKLAATDKEFDTIRRTTKKAKDTFNDLRKRRCDMFNKAYTHISERIDEVYKDLTKGKASPMGGVAYLSLEDSEEPYLHGIKYHAMPPMKRFRDMDQLSGGEKTMAALALLFAIHSYHPSPFFVLDEVDAALDNTNVGRIANYVRRRANPAFQFVVISLKGAFYEKARGLVGIWRDVPAGSSKTLTLDLDKYE